MRKPFNPIRRNRNIGTSRQGRGADNRLTIPRICHDQREWWGQLSKFITVERDVGRRKLTFIVERTRDDCVYASTLDDVCCMMSFIPASDWESLDTFVLRQSTRKEWSLAQSWGRLAYFADLGSPGKKTARVGPALFLEAVDPSTPWRVEKSLSPSDSAELNRLISDGHKADRRGRYILLQGGVEAIRMTQLYRTIPHEVGHWVDWLANVVRKSDRTSTPLENLEERYFARPQSEREAFAHRYADSVRDRLLRKHLIPFPRMIDVGAFLRDGLSPKDFALE
jgi:hypothetical protein